MKISRLLHAALSLLLCAGCASGNGQSWGISTARYSAPREQSLQLASAVGAVCEEIGRKRIVKLAYLWPINPLSETELRASERPSRRYATEVNAGDIGFSLLGFLIGVVTETTFVEACDSSFVTVDSSELARLRSLEQTVAARNATESEKMTSRKTPAELDSRSPFPALFVEPGQLRSRFTVYFSFASAQLSPAEEQKLVSIATELKKVDSSGKILIIGHADRSGQEQWNELLSGARARTIQARLKKAGLESRLIIPLAAGTNWPVRTTAASPNESDRRAEIIVVRESN